MMEIVLPYAYACAFKTMGELESRLFNCFQKHLDNINKHEFEALPLNLFSHPKLGRLRPEALEYLLKALEVQHFRDDYEEF